MPLDVLTTADNVRVQGPLNIINDPTSGGSTNANLNVAGNVTATGSVSALSGLSVSGAVTATNNVTVSGSLSALSGLSVSGAITATNNIFAVANLTVTGSEQVQSGMQITSGLQYDFINGGPATATTISQLLSAASSTITMTGSGRVIFLNPTATESTCILTPTGSSSATSPTFTNGMEVTLVNLHPSSASTITIPTGSAGPNNGSVITISGGNCARLIYVAALQSWLHVL